MDPILANPFKREIEEFRSAYLAAMDRVLASGWYILGKEVEAFEKDIASFLGSQHAVGCASGLDALMLAFRALNIGPGDEVITTPLSAAASALAITHVGARPVFVDVLPDTLCLDPAQVAKAMTSRTKAVLPVHLYGYPAQNSELLQICERHGIKLIEDCAQSIGARDAEGKMTGIRGVMGCFSFYPTKNLGAFGDGGLVCTDDPALAASLKMLRNYGQRARYEHKVAGYNSRLDEIQAAVLREKLKHLNRWTERRFAIAKRYHSEIHGVWKLPPPPGRGQNVYHLFPIQCDDREKTTKALKAAGVEILVHYPTLIPEQECYGPLSPAKTEELWPVAFRASRRLLSLPINPYVTDAEVERVIAALR